MDVRRMEGTIDGYIHDIHEEFFIFAHAQFNRQSLTVAMISHSNVEIFKSLFYAQKINNCLPAQ